MKKKLLYSVIALVAVTLFVTVAFAGGGTIPASRGAATENIVKTYANSQTDTVYFTRDPGEQQCSFCGTWGDSVSITSARIQRITNGLIQAPLAGDTLTAFASFSYKPDVATPTCSLAATVTLAPLCDQFMVVIVYAGSNNGVTSAHVRYQHNKMLTK